MDSQREYTAQQRAHMRAAYSATRPTPTTVFLRTFLPWQLLRFLWINLRMVIIIRRSHRVH